MEGGERNSCQKKMREEPEVFCYWLGGVALSQEDERLIGGIINNSNRGYKSDFAVILYGILLYSYLIYLALNIEEPLFKEIEMLYVIVATNYAKHSSNANSSLKEYQNEILYKTIIYITQKRMQQNMKIFYIIGMGLMEKKEE